MDTMQVILLTSTAKLPSRAHADDAGFDLFADERVEIKAWSRACVRTGLLVSIPAGCYGRIASRSGLAIKFGIDVIAGVIDRNYTGNIIVCLANNSDNDFIVEKGAKVAQLICERICYPEIKEVPGLQQRLPTDRGDKGFGSSGF